MIPSILLPLQEKPEEVVKTTIEKIDKREQHVREQHAREQQAHEGEKEKVPAEEPKDVPVPTAMEMALREAMERKGVDTVVSEPEKKKKRKTSDTSRELETIYARTLKTRSPR